MTINLQFNHAQSYGSESKTYGSGEKLHDAKNRIFDLEMDENGMFPHFNHFYNAALSDYLNPERGGDLRERLRNLELYAEIFKDGDHMYLALNDRQHQLLALYQMHKDGSISRIEDIPESILRSYD